MSARDSEFTEYVQARLAWLRRLGFLLCQDWTSADELVQAAVTQLYVHWGQARHGAAATSRSTGSSERA